MKKFLFCAALFFAAGFQAQTVSCSDLVQYAKSEDPYPEIVGSSNSAVLAKTEYYRLDGEGLVIAYIKSKPYDFYGKPYIFCGISSERWTKFKVEGMVRGYGKAFHDYIKDYTCNCK